MFAIQHLLTVCIKGEMFMIKNRQVTRSKKLIVDAIIKLLSNKTINQITVKEICEICNINRGTFYNHYLDIYDLINQIENDLIDELEVNLHKYSLEQLNNNSLPLFQDIIEFINQKYDVVNILFKQSEDSLFVDKLINLFKTRAINTWGSFYNCHYNKNYNYFIEYAIYGCLGIIKRWLKDGRKNTPEEIALLLENIVMNGANSLK